FNAEASITTKSTGRLLSWRSSAKGPPGEGRISNPTLVRTEEISSRSTASSAVTTIAFLRDSLVLIYFYDTTLAEFIGEPAAYLLESLHSDRAEPTFGIHLNCTRL